MYSVKLALLIAALVAFLLAALEIAPPRTNLIAAGLALCVIAYLIGG